MDTPLENPKGYEENNLINQAGNLKGKLLMIHGTDDDVVVWQHSLLFAKKCVEKGIPLDYFAYPAHKHNVLGKDRVHLMQKITDYFIQNLIPFFLAAFLNRSPVLTWVEKPYIRFHDCKAIAYFLSRKTSRRN